MVDELRATCATPTELLFKIAEDMRAEMKSGLESIHESKLPMLPSYVDNLPDGYLTILVCHAVPYLSETYIDSGKFAIDPVAGASKVFFMHWTLEALTSVSYACNCSETVEASARWSMRERRSLLSL